METEIQVIRPEIEQYWLNNNSSTHEINIYVRYSIVSQIRWARHIKNKNPWKTSIVYEI